MDPVLDLSLLEVAVALAVVAVAAGTQSTIGFGFNILAVPILALLDPDLVPIPTIVMGIPLTALTWRRERRHTDLSGMGWLIAGRLPGSFLGAALLAVVSHRFLDGFIATIVLGAVVVMGTGYTVAKSDRNAFAVGLASGITGASSAIGGPPLALLYHRDGGEVIRSTMALIFLMGQFVNLVALAAAGQWSSRPFQMAAILAPAMLAGYLSSSLLKDRVSPETLRRSVLGLSTAAALALGARALLAS